MLMGDTTGVTFLNLLPFSYIYLPNLLNPPIYYFARKQLLLLLTLAPFLAFGQTTLIPDPNFEQALIDLTIYTEL